MQILVVLAHPNEDSFNHAIAMQVCKTIRNNGHTPIFHDLYREKFDPELPGNEIARNVELPEEIAKHCEELVSSDGVIIIHPNWWGMPPALLKGWVDRVIRPGIAYEFIEGDSGEGVPVGLLKAKTALIFNTSNTIKEREESIFGDPLERIWKDCIFNLCGVKNVRRRMFGVIVTSTAEDRRKWLAEVHAKVDKEFPADS